MVSETARPSLYKPLCSDKAEIRLLRLHPGLLDDNIVCDLFNESLGDDAVYEALSYTWGDPTATRSIALQGIDVEITENLYVALQHLRYADSFRILWVDAICINQNDIMEKSYEVHRMRDIFGAARRVLSYLGKASDDSDLAMEYIANDERPELDRIFDEAPHVFQAVRNLYLRDYWSRIWVLQECVVAKEDPLIGCGAKWVSWLSMHAVGDQFHSWKLSITAAQAFVEAPGIQNSFILTTLRVQFQRGSRENLFNLVVSTPGFRFTNPRDRIYALLGMTTDADRKLWTPNYAISTSSLWLHFALYALLARQNFRVLSLNSRRFEHAVPSWAPDLSMPLFLPLAYIDTTHNMSRGNVASKMTPRMHFRPEDNTIIIRGRRLDEISQVRGPFTDLPDFDGPSQDKSRWLGVFELTYRALGTAKMNLFAEDGALDKVIAFMSFRLMEGYQAYDRSTGLGLGGFEAALQDPRLYTALMAANLPNSVKDTEGDFMMMLKAALLDRTFFLSNKGLLGIGPAAAREGDLLCSFHGAGGWYVVRPKAQDYQFIGDCHVYGLMDGDVDSFVRMTEGDGDGISDRLRRLRVKREVERVVDFTLR